MSRSEMMGEFSKLSVSGFLVAHHWVRGLGGGSIIGSFGSGCYISNHSCANA